ncbi:MAG: RNA 3'-phosphate cyclase [Rhizobiales bacterium PAR1]|nr:MAG: RNA 3'-phosphate cyclase [Rhizobiales bacterium PAR1]
MISIDGSLGEGGGQILRSSLTLAMVTGKPFAIENIRVGREKPGLMRQHLTAVKAAALICGAETRHAEIGSTRLVFEPGRLAAGAHVFNIGSAGSTSLVLQTLLLPLALADEPSRIVIQGGTHNLAAPPFEFMARAFLPLLARIGFRVSIRLTRPGFFPAGGGEIVVEIEPAAKLEPLALETRGKLLRRRIEAQVANLPFGIAKREVAHAGEMLRWADAELAPCQIDGAPSTGNVVLIEVEHEMVTEVFTGFGRQGVSAEAVAASAAREARDYLAGAHVIGPHLADQLLLPMALGAGGRFTTSPLSEHTRTNIATIQRFLDVSVQVHSETEEFVVELGAAL